MTRVLVLVCVLAVASTHAGEIAKKSVPAPVRKAFAAAFPRAEDVEWEKEGGNFEVEFELREVEMSVVLDPSGKILEKETSIQVKEVPQQVRDAVTEAYRGYTVRKAEKVEKSGEVTYEVELCRRVEVEVTPEGKVLGEEGDAGKESGDGGEDDDDDGDDDSRSGSLGSGPSLTPLASKVTLSAEITHPYFPLSKVPWAELVEAGERVVRKVADSTRTVAGIECLVLEEHEYLKGKLKEISYNFFAQDPDGNVYYFGEDVDDYRDGKVVGHGGAWIVGDKTREPCLFMPAVLQTGFSFKRENSPPAADECDQIGETDASLEVPAGAFTGVLVVLERDRKPGPPWKEKKYYASGVGLISENGELNLTEYGEGPPQR